MSTRRFSMLRSYALPDVFTIGNAASGTIAIFLCLNFLAGGGDRFLWAAFVLVPLGVVFDAFDGWVARRRGRASVMGADMDSLADVVTFGVAPAVLGFTLGLRGVWDSIILVYFVVCGLSRLARYNVTSEALSDERGKIEMHLVAEGLRKLAMVARLIATGALVGRGCLLWDEPEANLNPVLIKTVAQVLFALAAQGVQIFVATHSLFLMRELSLLQQAESAAPKSVRYFGLHRDGERVAVTQGDALTQSGGIAALDEDVQQAERVLDQAMGVLP